MTIVWLQALLGKKITSAPTAIVFESRISDGCPLRAVFKVVIFIQFFSAYSFMF